MHDEMSYKFEKAVFFLNQGRVGKYMLSRRSDGLFDILHDSGSHVIECVPESVILAITKAKDESEIGNAISNLLNPEKEHSRKMSCLIDELLKEASQDGEAAEIIIRKAQRNHTPVRREKIDH